MTITSFLLALLVGQLVATVVVVPLLPRHERHFASFQRGAMGKVAQFGLWRAAQQAVRPTMLTLVRVLIAAEVGRAVFGQLEAARVYMAPALLLVQGIASYLMSSYAQIQKAPTHALARRADRASVVMFVGALVIGGIGTIATPVLGHFVTGPEYSMKALAVFGWAVYAASSAAVAPFASLSAVRGKQPVVVSIRVFDSTLSILFVWIVLQMPGLDVSWAPFALAAGSFIGGAAIRSFVLKPLVRAEASLAERATENSPVVLDRI